MIDIVFPSGNEQEFLATARRLGWKQVCFAYEFGKVAELKEKMAAHPFVAAVAKRSNYNAARFAPKLLVSIDEEPTSLLRAGKMDAILGMEKFRLTQVHCKFARENGIALCFGLSAMHSKPKLIEWLHKNARLINKYKTPLVLGSFATSPLQMRSHHDLVGLYATIGFDRRLIKEGFEALEK